MEKINIYGLTLDEIGNLVSKLGLSKFRSIQIAEWLYKKNVYDFDKMTNLSLEDRKILSEQCRIDFISPINKIQSKDGTTKYVFKFDEKVVVETVLIPDNDRLTICVSSQYGCALGCKFCHTAKISRSINLKSGQILNQVAYFLPENKITNIVFMGMGEPLLNYEEVSKSISILTHPKLFGLSKQRITLSTVGIIPELKNFLQIFPCNLAISLHTPFSDERKLIMPIENKYPIKEVLNLIRHYTKNSSKTISIEYIVFKDFNHSENHAKELARILEGIPSKINLITYHKSDDFNLSSPTIEEIVTFQNILKQKGFSVTIRKSRGEDIAAACGMLANKYISSEK